MSQQQQQQMQQQMQQSPSALASAKDGFGMITGNTIGRKHKTAGVMMIVLVIVLVITLMALFYYYEQYSKCHKANFSSNLTTGGNNSLWWNGARDAGQNLQREKVGTWSPLVRQPMSACQVSPSEAALARDQAQAQVAASQMSDAMLASVLNGGDIYQ